MTPADWRALAERFEAADEETVYECVGALAMLINHKASWPADKWRGAEAAIDAADEYGLPDLLLGVVVACVPEGWRWQIHGGFIRGDAHPVGEVTRDFDWKVRSHKTLPAAALGDAVCRAWAEVAGGKEVA